MELVFALFGEAWAHRRRRQRLIGAGLILVAAAIVAGLLFADAGNGTAGSAAAGTYRVEPASSVLAFHDLTTGRTSVREGVRAGVIVGLKRPADSVVAVVEHRSEQLKSLKLRNGALSDTAFSGSFWPASLRNVTEKEHPAKVSLLVHLRINYQDGDRVVISYQQQITAKQL